MTIVKRLNECGNDLNLYAAHIHDLNLKWWMNADGSPKDLDKGERFMLMVSELAEGMEGDRKSLMDDHLPQYPMIWVELADCVIRVMDSGHVYGWKFNIYNHHIDLIEHPQTVGAKLLNIVCHLTNLACFELYKTGPTSLTASTVIVRCRMLAIELGCTDFWTVVYDKLVFNTQRPDHKHENRQGQVGQKKY